MRFFSRFTASLLLASTVASPAAFGWGRTGHMMINKIAAEKLPADLPAFLHTHAFIQQMEYQGPEPDRWKSYATEPELVVVQSPDHFIDLEWADAAIGTTLPRRRYDYIRSLMAAQPQHPDLALTPEKVGMLPYQIEEVWERLKSSMRDYRALEKEHQDTKPVEALIVFYAGWLGHYVADGSQPLHVTAKYNGWYGPNPNGYTTEHHIHAKFESDFVKNNIHEADVAALVPAKPVPHGDIFDDTMAYLRHSNSLVEKTYQLEKAGAFDGAGTAEGKQFTLQQMAEGATELRDLIVYAWEASATPLPPSKYND